MGIKALCRRQLAHRRLPERSGQRLRQVGRLFPADDPALAVAVVRRQGGIIKIFQQRGLSVALLADDDRLIPRQQRQRKVLQQGPAVLIQPKAEILYFQCSASFFKQKSFRPGVALRTEAEKRAKSPFRHEKSTKRQTRPLQPPNGRQQNKARPASSGRFTIHSVSLVVHCRTSFSVFGSIVSQRPAACKSYFRSSAPAALR